MNISANAFSGDLMKQFNGLAISPAMSDPNTQVTGVSGDTKMYYFVDEKTKAVLQSKALFLSDAQVTA